MTSLPRRTFLQRLALASAAAALPARSYERERVDGRGPRPHTILSCNIRVALLEDEAKGHGWSARRDLCIDVIRAQRPDVICLQEVLREQNRDLERAFPAFGSFGFEGPEMDAHPTGYHGISKHPILYSRERYDLVSAGDFWLSETPHLPGSLSWDSARARHMNWLRLRERATGREFRVLNTHLDHQGQRAREEQMKMIVAEAARYPAGFPQLFAGDFNADANNPVLAIARDAGWTDTHAAAPGATDDGPTYHAFRGADYVPKTRRGRIDFILSRGPVRTLASRIVRDRRDGLYPSDHYFLAAHVVF